jgi:uncharacterized protein (TIGR02453 family)
MLQTSTVAFLQKLAKNNNKIWFDKHRDEYEAAKDDFEALVTGIINGLAVTEPAFKQQKAKDSIFRIYRDVRFSKDKTPYKTHFSADFSKGGRKSPGAGYYLHIEPGGKSFAGGGIWMPDAPLLKSVRQEIDYNFKEFKAIIEDKKFKKTLDKINGEQLKTMPQGYTADNPAIEYLKMKSFVTGSNIPNADITGKGLVKKVLEIFTTMRPFINFLNRAAV